jgi:phosphoribosylformylglycinamidine synthase I
MQPQEIKVCILRVGGTNCDAETKRALDDLYIKSEIVHLNTLSSSKNLLDYAALVFPGGFSYGDYVRAGVILAKRIQAKLSDQLKQFVNEGRPILGICNGFQVLVEAGLLPGFNGVSEMPQLALGTNHPIGYHCTWVHLKHENNGKCIFTKKITKDQILAIPVAHAEGRVIFKKEKEHACLQRLIDNDQLVFRYCTEKGEYAKGKHPVNPNGSFYDIAGVCDSSGTIFGLMPHPERAYYGWQLLDWTKQEKLSRYGDGKTIFESMTEYLIKKF